MRTAADIAARAVCLGVLTFRARFEGVRFDSDGRAAEQAAGMIAGVTNWFRDAGLAPALIAPEQALFDLPPNNWERAVLHAIGAALIEESIAVLFAGLNLVAALPAYDSRVDSEELLRLLPFLSDSPFVTHHGMDPREEWTVMATSVSRAPDANLARGEQVAELWWWRVVSESLVRAGTVPRARVAAVLRDGAPTGRGLGIGYAGDDFAAFGKPYAELTDDEHRAVSVIAEARVRAFRWMQGDVAWDEVAMDS
ncbi:MAG TPA: hypothetical protein VIF57_32240 [Polyangia bacterium]|jgi:hypothetical protein